MKWQRWVGYKVLLSLLLVVLAFLFIGCISASEISIRQRIGEFVEGNPINQNLLFENTTMCLIAIYSTQDFVSAIESRQISRDDNDRLARRPENEEFWISVERFSIWPRSEYFSNESLIPSRIRDAINRAGECIEGSDFGYQFTNIVFFSKLIVAHSSTGNEILLYDSGSEWLIYIAGRQ